MAATPLDEGDRTGAPGEGVSASAPQPVYQSGQPLAVLPQRPAGFGPQYIDPGAWDAQASEIDNADDLTAIQWSKILRINKALYGFTLREQEKDIVKARLPAFSLLDSSAATSTTSSDVTPDFEVWDPSSIAIKETKTDLQRSLAVNGFSSQSIEAALGGGAFGVSAGISAILKAEKSAGDASMLAAATKEYYAAYNFPRARLFLDEYTLQVSPQCQRALTDLKREPTDENLRDFSERFGHVFATVFQLGGQLQSSKFASSLLSDNEADKRDALKAAVGASFAAQYVSASAKYSRDAVKSSQNTERKISDLSELAWTARGGNTLLSANPPQWASTLASHKNWRVIEQEKVVTLHELIGRLPQWEKIPELFEKIAKKRIQRGSLIAPAPPKWNGRIRLTINSHKLFWNGLDSGTLTPAPTTEGDEQMEAVFTVLNANGAETAGSPALTSLPADYPLFLISGREHIRLSGRRNLIPGVYVDSAGKLKAEDGSGVICRFSLRLAGDRGPWRRYDKQPQTRIKSGDRVNLYCHSLGVGPYANIERPPRSASPIVYDEAGQKVGVWLVDLAKGADAQAVIKKYDLGKLSTDDQNTFEKKGYLTDSDRVGRIKQVKGNELYASATQGMESISALLPNDPASASYSSYVKDSIVAGVSIDVGFVAGGVHVAHKDLKKNSGLEDPFQSFLIECAVAEFTVLFD